MRFLVTVGGNIHQKQGSSAHTPPPKILITTACTQDPAVLTPMKDQDLSLPMCTVMLVTLIAPSETVPPTLLFFAHSLVQPVQH